ncbi:MAG: trypsin-like peptidase domain-containing protein [Planctomycetota bacterium]|nr:trypsin-like peptidase domain-containing protein [Planctomycetota bacterium]
MSAQEKNSDLLGELEENVSRRIEEAEASVVAIVRVSKNTLEDPTSPDFVPRNFGTGVAISTDGLILTCYHLLGNPAENDYYVWKNGVSFRVRKAEKVEAVIGADPWTDLAVLKIDSSSELRPIPMADPVIPRRGQFVISLGNPYGIAKDGQSSASFGIISNLLRQRSLQTASELGGGKSDTFSQYGTLLQTDARMHRGTSGGPLLNLQGKMIGLTTSLAAANHFDGAAGYAIPVDSTFLRTVQRLQQGKSAEFGFLGIATRELTASQRQQFGKGVVVTQVVDNTPADLCGLRFGDIITQVNQNPVQSSNALLRELSGRFAGDRIDLTIQRQAFPKSPYRKQTIKVELGKKKINSRQPTIGINDFSFWRGIKVDYATAIDNLSLHFSKIDPQGCVAIVDVRKNSPAAAAGLKKMDFISHVGGKRVKTPEQFYQAVRTLSGQVELTRVVNSGGTGEKVLLQQ